MNKEKIIAFFKEMRKKNRLMLLGIAGGVLIVLVVLMVSLFHNSEKQVTTVAQSTLEKIVEIQELSTVKYTYNAIATAYKDKSDKVKYYVAYEGIVEAGIDFNKIQFEVNEKEKKLTIILPEIEIQNVTVNSGTLEFIFEKDRYETETIIAEAYELCIEDLNSRILEESALYDYARDNAKLTIEALFAPWIEQLDETYSIEIR